MSLKFQKVDWDDKGKGLMFVSFDNNGQTLKWYPKWKDLVAVFDSALATEDYRRSPPGASITIRGKLRPYFLFVCLKLLTRSLLIEAKVDSAKILEFNRLTDQIDAKFLKK